MPKLEPKNKNIKKNQTSKELENEVISAYSEEGKKRLEKNKEKGLTPGFKVFLFIVYGLGLVAALAIVFALQQCS